MNVSPSARTISDCSEQCLCKIMNIMWKHPKQNKDTLMMMTYVSFPFKVTCTASIELSVKTFRW